MVAVQAVAYQETPTFSSHGKIYIFYFFNIYWYIFSIYMRWWKFTELLWLSFHDVCKSNHYTVQLKLVYSAVCQLYLNETRRKKRNTGLGDSLFLLFIHCFHCFAEASQLFVRWKTLSLKVACCKCNLEKWSMKRVVRVLHSWHTQQGCAGMLRSHGGMLLPIICGRIRP